MEDAACWLALYSCSVWFLTYHLERHCVTHKKTPYRFAYKQVLWRHLFSYYYLFPDTHQVDKTNPYSAGVEQDAGEKSYKAED